MPITDLITGVSSGSNRPVATTVTASRTAGVTTLTCAALTNWETTLAIHFQTYRIDSSGNKVQSSAQDWKGDVVGNTITNLTLTSGGADAGNAIGDIVEAMPTAAWADELAQGLLVQHDADGTHKATITTNTINEKTPANGVTIDGVNIKDAKLNTVDSIIPSNLVSSAGSSWNWQSWTPTWTNITVGNGTLTAKYTQIGKTVFFRIHLAFGTTTSVGGRVAFSLPLTSTTYPGATDETPLGNARFLDNGVAAYHGVVVTNSTTSAVIQVLGAGGSTVNYADLGSSTPHSWGTGDVIAVTGSYEAA